MRCITLAASLLLLAGATLGQNGAGWALGANPVWQLDERLSVLKAVPGNAHQTIAATESGHVWLLEQGSGRATSLLQLGLDASGDLGLSDLAFHPDFPADNRVFVAVTDLDPELGPVTRVTAWHWRRDGATHYRIDAPYTLFSVPADGIWRTQALLAFDEAGHLLVALGDGGAEPATLNDAGNWRGKLLRMAIDRRRPGQPFIEAGAAPGSAVIARGLRSPAGMVSGGPLGTWVLDLGPEGAARLFAATEGAHFGWPCRAGSRQLRRTGGCDSITVVSPQWDSGPREPPVAPWNLVVQQVPAFSGDGLPAHTLVFGDPASNQVIGYSPFGPREFRASTGTGAFSLLQADGGRLYGFNASDRQLYHLTAAPVLQVSGNQDLRE